ncbi:gibberellin 2-beta-dioxygenase 2-like [Cucurbita maxima]|uniref:gibberellin 2beta-dioxygenase n=1 Tax=Cucurbita maxima TaxID=3661 RepID=A0A6J1JXB5_CUCMA|nr:gibberellin 2-beta-dioxygenase 2-like [Cucurbita maxima]
MPCPTAMRTKKTEAVGIPTIDLSQTRPTTSKSILHACHHFGFFKLINHGVSHHAISRLECQAFDFFAKTAPEKHRAGPAAPFGYGTKAIGPNGDTGDLEYLLLRSDPASVLQTSPSISNDPSTFSYVVNEYVKSVKDLGCEILDLVGEGLWLPNKSVFSDLIRDVHSDSVLRINYYPAVKHTENWELSSKSNPSNNRIGFGEHSDPQILTILRSNDVDGLQISLQDGLWRPVCPDPSAFYVLIGDALQAMTNGRFVSVRHRAMANSSKKARMSIMYFGAPPLNAWIAPLSEMIPPNHQSLYKPFTWAQYKKAAYSLRLADSRLDLFKAS